MILGVYIVFAETKAMCRLIGQKYMDSDAGVDFAFPFFFWFVFHMSFHNASITCVPATDSIHVHVCVLSCLPVLAFESSFA